MGEVAAMRTLVKSDARRDKETSTALKSWQVSVALVPWLQTLKKNQLSAIDIF